MITRSPVEVGRDRSEGRAGDRAAVRAGALARGIQVGVGLAAQAVIVFGAAGRLDWAWAWAFLGIYGATVLVNTALLMTTSPETVAERGQPGKMRGWDRVVGGLWGLAQFVALPLVAGLDARFSWTGPLDVTWHVAGGILFAAGLAFFSWAMVVNAYFSTAARVQSERGQTVCRSGPYQLVRHPGYAGTMLQSVGIALLLGSFWALVSASAAIVLIVIRTLFEDRMLQDELAGYREFTREVPYRLVPGVW